MFSSWRAGRCRLRRKPATARHHPTPNKGYQAGISNPNAMEGLPSRPVFQRAVPMPMRRSLDLNPCLCELSGSESMSVWFFLYPMLCPRAAPSFRSLALAPIGRSEAWPVRCSAVLLLKTFDGTLLRRSFAPSPCVFDVTSRRTPARAPLLRYVSPRLCFLLFSPCHSLDSSRRAAPLLSLFVPL